MIDVTSIGALISSLKSAAELTKLVRDSGITLEESERKLRFAEVISALADATMTAANFRVLLQEKEERIRILESQLARRLALKWREPAYWATNDDGVEEPYCQKCYEGDDRIVRLHGAGEGRFGCTVCLTSFITREQRDKDTAKLRAARGR